MTSPAKTVAAGSFAFHPGTPPLGGALDVEGLTAQLAEALAAGLQRAHDCFESTLGAVSGAYPVRVEMALVDELQRAGPGARVEGLVGPGGGARPGVEAEAALVRLRAVGQPAGATGTGETPGGGEAEAAVLGEAGVLDEAAVLGEAAAVAGHELAHHLLQRRLGPLAGGTKAELVVECLAWALADAEGEQGPRVPADAALWGELPRATSELVVAQQEADLGALYGAGLAALLERVPTKHRTARRRLVCSALGWSLLDNRTRHQPQVGPITVVRLLLSAGLRWGMNPSARRPPFPRGRLGNLRTLGDVADLAVDKLGGAFRLSMAAAALSAGDNAGPAEPAPDPSVKEVVRLPRARQWLDWWVVAEGLPDHATHHTPLAQWLMPPPRLPGRRPPAPDGLLAVLAGGQDAERAAVLDAAKGIATWEGRVLWARVAARLLSAAESPADGCVPLQRADRVQVYVTDAARPAWSAAHAQLAAVIRAATGQSARSEERLQALPEVVPFDGRWQSLTTERAPFAVVVTAPPKPAAIFASRLQASTLPLLSTLFGAADSTSGPRVEAWEQTPHAFTYADGRQRVLGPPLRLDYQEGTWRAPQEDAPSDPVELPGWIDRQTRTNQLLTPAAHLLAWVRFGFVEPA